TLLAGQVPAEMEKLQRVQFQVHRVIGSHNLQAYLTRLDDGSYTVLPLQWCMAEQRWITREGGFIRPPSPAFYTGEKVDRWNYTCIACHNTDPKPGLIPSPRGSA